MIRQHIKQFYYTQLYNSAETYTNMQINLKIFLLFPIRSLFLPEMSNILPLLLYVQYTLTPFSAQGQGLVCRVLFRIGITEMRFILLDTTTKPLKLKKK
jgi:hypothetical protein